LALKHEFLITDKEYALGEDFLEEESVEISDYLLLYINDTLKWIVTCWNNSKVKPGLNYYGYSIIKGEALHNFTKIIDVWKMIFLNAPTVFSLTGNYLLEENQYEEIFVDATKLINELNGLYQLCIKALNENKQVLHKGI